MATSTAPSRKQDFKERRIASRQPLPKPTIGVLQSVDGDCWSRREVELHTFVDVLNVSSCGALVEGCRELEAEAGLVLVWYDCLRNRWTAHCSVVVWCKPHTLPGYHVAGLRFLDPVEPDSLAAQDTLKARHQELAFLEGTELLESLPRHALVTLLDRLERVEVRAGERLISQGAPGDALYLVYQGELVVRVDNDNAHHQVGRLRQGDVVGEMAVFTGDRRMAHVDAESDALLFRLSCDDFDAIARKQRGLRNFLTEIMAQRFQCSPLIAHRTVGKYVIRHMIGKGGWGLVYHGEHKNLGLEAAIKMLKHDMAIEPLFLQRFRGEAKTIAGLNHPNIVQIYDIEHIYRTVFIVMEYLQGESLGTLLAREGAMPSPRIAGILEQVLDGLGYAHDRGIVHRDVKPDNIFLLKGRRSAAERKDRVKLLDFGLSSSRGVSNVGIAGTVQYASPEQIDDEPEDERSDIYSVGIMAYEMATGERPYPEDDLMAMLEQRCSSEIPPPRLKAPDLAPELDSFIVKACRIAPEERFQNTTEALEHLAPLLRRYDSGPACRQHLTALQLFFADEQQAPLQRLLEDFVTRAEHLGVTVTTATFRDL